MKFSIFGYNVSIVASNVAEQDENYQNGYDDGYSTGAQEAFYEQRDSVQRPLPTYAEGYEDGYFDGSTWNIDTEQPPISTYPDLYEAEQLQHVSEMTDDEFEHCFKFETDAKHAYERWLEVLEEDFEWQL